MEVTRYLFFLLLVISLNLQAQEGVKYAPKKPVLTKAPQIKQFIEAEYPEDAVKEGKEADVFLEVDIDETGKVTDVRLIKPAGDGFDQAAIKAVKGFVFEPAEIDGKPSPITIEYVYHFRLQKVVEQKAEAESREVIKAKVKERGSGLPVIGAAIAIDGMEEEVTTNEKGVFIVKDLPPGKRKLKIIAPDYETLETEVEIREGMVAEVTFYLKPLHESPYQTIVRGEREKEVVARYTVSERELTTVPGTFGDPVRVVQNLPGMARSPYVLGVLLVRGAFPQDSGVFIDGVEVPAIFHFMGGPSILNPQFLSRIDFYPGNFSVRYGGMIGGLVDVGTSKEMPEVWSSTLDLNLFFASGYLELPVSKKVSVKIGGRRSYYDFIIPAVLKASGYKATTVVPVYWDYQTRIDVALKGDDHLYVFAYGSQDSLSAATTDNQTAERITLGFRMGFHRLAVSHLWHITPKLTNTFIPTIGYDNVSMDMGRGFVDLDTFAWGVRDEMAWSPRENLTLRWGLDAGGGYWGYSFEMPPLKDYIIPGEIVWHPRSQGKYDTTGVTERISDHIWGEGFAIYIENIWTVWDRLKVIPGVRFDSIFYMGRKRFSFDPRFTARLDVGKGWTIKGGAGIFHQLPNEMYLDKYHGNPDLDLEWAEHYTMGFEKKIGDAILLDCQGFYIRRHDRAVPTKEIVATDIGGQKRIMYNNQGKGRAYGMEFLLKHDVTERFYGWISYTLSRSEDQMDADSPMSLNPFDQTHILTAVANVRLGKGWEVGGRFRLVSGNPETPTLDSTFVADGNRYIRYQGEPYSSRRPLFHQLDIRVDKAWEFEKWMLSVYLDIQNIYNAKNPEFRIWDYRYRRYYDVRGLPILPTIGIKGRF